MAKRLSLRKQESVTAYAFITPYLLGIIIFGLVPMIYSIYISMMDMNGLKDMSLLKFVGLDNYIHVFNDKDAMGSFTKTLIFALVEVPCMVIGSFLLALAMNKKFYMRGAIRTVLLLPYVSVVSAVAIAWQVILSPYGGPVNKVLELFGVQNPPMWLLDSDMALPIAAVIYVYMNLAFQAVVFLAALQEVPQELYEASSLDGASRWTKFRHVTFPMISPTTFFILITSILGSAQSYGLIAALTQGGPGGSTEVAAFNIVKNAFSFNQYSFATAQSVLLFLILTVITIVQWRGQKKWVNY